MLSHKLTTSIFLSNWLKSSEKYRINNKLIDDRNIAGVCQWRMYLRNVSRKNFEKFILSLPVFVTYCYVTKYSKMQSLKTIPIYCLEFCGSSIWARLSWIVLLLHVWLARVTHLNFSTRTSAGPTRYKQASLMRLVPAVGPHSPPQLLSLQSTWQAFLQQSTRVLRGEAQGRHLSSLCRQTLFYCTSLYCTLQMLHFFFLQIESLWQPCIERVYWHHFSNRFRWWLAFLSSKMFFIKVCTLSF